MVVSLFSPLLRRSRQAVCQRRILTPMLVLAGLAGCGTDATGVDACRQIEFARCEGAEPCAFDVDVDACRRFAQDNCLHGLVEHPGEAAVRACTEAIETAVECADRKGSKTKASACDDDELATAGSAEVCELVLEPERLTQCEFLGRSESADGDDEPDTEQNDDRKPDAAIEVLDSGSASRDSDGSASTPDASP